MTIDKFEGEYEFLKISYPCEITIDGITYPSVEHAFHAEKTTDPITKEDIAYIVDVDDMRDYVRNYVSPEYSRWEDIKDEVMLSLLRLKFNSNSELAMALFDTDDEELVFSNKNTYWGVNSFGEGQNVLGDLLMQVRSEIAPVMEACLEDLEGEEEEDEDEPEFSPGGEDLERVLIKLGVPSDFAEAIANMAELAVDFANQDDALYAAMEKVDRLTIRETNIKNNGCCGGCKTYY